MRPTMENYVVISSFELLMLIMMFHIAVRCMLTFGVNSF